MKVENLRIPEGYVASTFSNALELAMPFYWENNDSWGLFNF